MAGKTGQNKFLPFRQYTRQHQCPSRLEAVDQGDRETHQLFGQDVGKYNIKCAFYLREGGCAEFHHSVHSVQEQVFMRHFQRPGVDVQSDYPASPEFCSGDGKDAGTGPYVEYCGRCRPLILRPRTFTGKQLFKSLKAEPGSGVSAGAEGHAWVQFDDKIAGLGGECLPGRFYNQPFADAGRFEVLFPVVCPIFFPEQGNCRLQEGEPVECRAASGQERGNGVDSSGQGVVRREVRLDRFHVRLLDGIEGESVEKEVVYTDAAAGELNEEFRHLIHHGGGNDAGNLGPFHVFHQ